MADPQEDSPFDSSGYVIRMQQNARTRAILAQDQSPDEAARAMDLSDVSGVPPALIHSDLENFEAKQRAAITSEILKHNQKLSDYVNSHPLAAAISNDDWGNLHNLSQSVDKLPHRGPIGPIPALGRIFEAGAKQAQEAFGNEPLLSPYEPPTPENRVEFAMERGLNYPLGYLAGNVARLAFGRVLPGLTMGAAGLAGQTAAEFGVKGGPQFAQTVAEASMDPGFWASIEPTLVSAGPPGEAVDVVGMAISKAMKAFHDRMLGPNRAALKPEEIADRDTKFDSAGQKVSEAIQAGDPWLRAGVMPPQGVHPLIDQLHAERAKDDKRAIAEVDSATQKTNTLERSPEIMQKNFFEDAHGVRDKIGISPQGIEMLYPEDKLPELGDGKLGDIPGAIEAVKAAKSYGMDVKVPLSAWFAKVDPEAKKEIGDQIRYHPDAMTVEEGKEAEKPVELRPEGEEARAQEPTPVDQVRKAAGLDNIEERIAARQGEMIRIGAEGPFETKVLVPTNRWSDAEANVQKIVEDYFKKIAPQTETYFLSGARRVQIGGKDVQGAYVPARNMPAILYALHDPQGNFRLPDDILKTTRHEFMHYLWLNGFLTSAEKEFLSNAARRENWFDKYRIHERYPGASDQLKIEEAVAEEFGHWFTTPQATSRAKEIFEKIKSLLLGLREQIIQTLGFDPSVTDLFHRIESGEVGSRKIGRAAEGAPKAQEPEASGLGITKGELTEYQKRMEEERASDAELMRKLALKQEAVKATKDWKEKEALVRDEVEKSLALRPDIAADRFFRTGSMFGEKQRRVRLDEEMLTAEQKKGLSEEHYGKNGIDPNIIAKRFGFDNGQVLVDALSRLEADRKQQDLTPSAHFNQLRDVDTERLMKARFGDKEQNILKAIEDHILSPEAMDRYHEDLLRIGTRAYGEGFKIDKEGIKRGAKLDFEQIKLGDMSTREFLATSGRAGRNVEKSLLDEKPTDAFKYVQQRNINALLAQLMSKADRVREKAEDTFNQLRKPYSSNAGINPEHLNWIHDIIGRIGFTPRRTPNDLAREISASKNKTLQEFVADRNAVPKYESDDVLSEAMSAKLHVAPFLWDPAYKKPIDQMTFPELEAVYHSVLSLVADGKGVKKVEYKGNMMDEAEAVKLLTDQQERVFGAKGPRPAGLPAVNKVQAAAGVWVIRPEFMFNRIDLDNPKGVHNQMIVRPLVEGENDVRHLVKEYDKKFREAWNYRPTYEPIENKFWKDPGTDGYMDMTDDNFLSIIANIGNPLQRMKLKRGYGHEHSDEQLKLEQRHGYTMDMNDPMMNWVFNTARKVFGDAGAKEAFQRQQRLGDMFDELFELDAKKYRDRQGYAPAKVELTPIETPWGTFKGWYHPLIRDPIRSTLQNVKPEDFMDESGYYRPAPNAGFTKPRTGAVYPILLDFSAVPFKIKTMINDIALRDPVTNVAKIFYNNEFRTSFIKHMGREWYDELVPMLRDIVGQQAYSTIGQRWWVGLLDGARQNLINQMIGANPGTVMKHAPTAAIMSMREIGPKQFALGMRKLFGTDPTTGEWNYQLMMRLSGEIPNRMRNWQETITGSKMEFFEPVTIPGQLRDVVRYLGAAPVAISDFMSAGPTWLGKYYSLIQQGEDVGEAVFQADRAVRRAHGSSIGVSKPKIMRSGPIGNAIVPFYNFFNTAANLQYEAAWKAKMFLEKRQLDGKGIADISSDGIITLKPGSYHDLDSRALEFRAGASKIPQIMGYALATTAVIAATEQLTEWALRGDPDWKHKGVFGRYIQPLIEAEASVWPIGRNLAGMMFHGYLGSMGLYETAFERVAAFYKQLNDGKVGMRPEHAAQTIRNVNFLLGLASGWTNEEMGKVGEYVWNLAHGRDKADTKTQIFRGLATGRGQRR